MKVGGVGGGQRTHSTPRQPCILHPRMVNSGVKDAGSHLEEEEEEEEEAWPFRHRTRSPTHTHVSFNRHTVGRTY